VELAELAFGTGRLFLLLSLLVVGQTAGSYFGLTAQLDLGRLPVVAWLRH
jgi:hypothetical protein